MSIVFVRRSAKGVDKLPTTLATLATTSKSETKDDRVTSTELTREGDRSAMSRLHSNARAWNIASVIRRDLDESSSDSGPKILQTKTYALIRRLPPRAFRHSDLKRFSSSTPSFVNLPR